MKIDVETVFYWLLSVTLVLAILTWYNVIALSWTLILAPLWIPISIVLVVTVAVLAMGGRVTVERIEDEDDEKR